jgi:UDP-N-acetylglucosamine acyltransferase
MVNQDVPPFGIVQGDRARLVGVNEVGLRRHGVSEEEILALRKAFRTLFWSERPLAARRAAIAQEALRVSHIATLLEFVETTKRGLVSLRRAARAA